MSKNEVDPIMDNQTVRAPHWVHIYKLISHVKLQRREILTVQLMPQKLIFRLKIQQPSTFNRED